MPAGCQEITNCITDITTAGMIIMDGRYITINHSEKFATDILIPTTTDRNTEAEVIAVHPVSMKRPKAKETKSQKNTTKNPAVRLGLLQPKTTNRNLSG
jgi:hypothetical protein